MSSTSKYDMRQGAHNMYILIQVNRLGFPYSPAFSQAAEQNLWMAALQLAWEMSG